MSSAQWTSVSTAHRRRGRATQFLRPVQTGQPAHPEPPRPQREHLLHARIRRGRQVEFGHQHITARSPCPTRRKGREHPGESVSSTLPVTSSAAPALPRARRPSRLPSRPPQHLQVVTLVSDATVCCGATKQAAHEFKRTALLSRPRVDVEPAEPNGVVHPSSPIQCANEKVLARPGRRIGKAGGVTEAAARDPPTGRP